MHLYTRTGDQGMTALRGGARVPKHDARLEAYGTLDELNCGLGLLRTLANPVLLPAEDWDRIQGDLFVIGGALASPEPAPSSLSLWALTAMEASIDALCERTQPLRTFILPGGSPAAAQAHVARAVCRRAERRVSALREQTSVPPEAVTYLNRLSDWLFAYARAENAVARIPDTPWVPIR